MGFVKQIDVLPLINRTPSREPHLLFTEPYFISRRVIITAGSVTISGGIGPGQPETGAAGGPTRSTNTSAKTFPMRRSSVTDIPSALRSVAEGAVDACHPQHWGGQLLAGPQ